MASFVKGTPQSTVNQYYQNNPWDARGTPTISNQPRSTMGQAQPTPTPSQGTPYGTLDMSAYSKPFASTTTDWMGNTYSSPEAASAQQGATVWGLTQQRAQQLGDLYSKGTPLSPLNMNAAYQSGAQMLEDGWQNPFLERLLPQAPPTQYRPQRRLVAGRVTFDGAPLPRDEAPPTQYRPQPTPPQRPGGQQPAWGRRSVRRPLPPQPAPTPPRQPSAPQPSALLADDAPWWMGEFGNLPHDPRDTRPAYQGGRPTGANAGNFSPPRQPAPPQRPSPPSQFPVGPGLRLHPRDEAQRQERLRQEEAARAQEEMTRRNEQERLRRLRGWDEFDRRAEAQGWIGNELHGGLWAGHPTGATKQNPARGQTDMQRRNAAEADRRWRQFR